MKYIYLLALYFCSITTFAQSKLETAIKSLDTNYAQEKVYLLFDKEDYIAGDNIWFKAYTLNGYKPSLISTNLIVELYDKEKVFLLFDKEYYIAGDNNWFKAYTLNGYKPSLISTNLIVEL